jgi:hypothetical protein
MKGMLKGRGGRGEEVGGGEERRGNGRRREEQKRWEFGIRKVI